ncbi:MAG: hypothetical protein A2V99_01290 [Spirochaetes bacterium RBG_16_67_19]|nr:MAG: hypothetical protein A2V99_01290 [Spirochaetes bacterium RBG_16_67_19]
MIAPLTAKFRITVSGGALVSAMVTEIAGSTSPTEATIYLPGSGTYNVTADGLDLSGVILTSGSATVDAVPGVNYVTIVMQPMIKLYVSNRTGNTVSVINGLDGSSITTIAVAAAPIAIGVNPVTRKVYVAHFGADISVIDGSTDTVSTTIIYGVSGDFPSIGVNPVANKIYAAWQYDSPTSVQIIDGVTDILGTPYSANTYPTSIAFNTASNKVYVLDWGSSDIQVLDGTTDVLLTTIPLISSTEKCGIAANSATNKIYFTDGAASGSVYVVDGSTDTVLATPIPVGGNLTGPDEGAGVAVNPITNRVYVTNSLDNTVSVIDGIADAVIATIPVGTAPRGVAVSKNYNKVYVANRLDATISIIDGATNTVTNTVPVGVEPQFIGVLGD